MSYNERSRVNMAARHTTKNENLFYHLNTCVFCRVYVLGLSILTLTFLESVPFLYPCVYSFFIYFIGQQKIEILFSRVIFLSNAYAYTEYVEHKIRSERKKKTWHRYCSNCQTATADTSMRFTWRVRISWHR